ncbi:MAG: mechanosensitive ion channel [Deltaproteobacteria bacterium]|nr:mechanosensitive ion channel [Deltaproteobacteria bacterium]
MRYWFQLWDEATASLTIPLVASLVLVQAMVRAWGVDTHRQMRGLALLVGLHLMLLPAVAWLQPAKGSAYVGLRVTMMILAALAIVGIASRLLFGVVMPRLHLRAPRILQDVIAAVTSMIAILAIAARAGFNLSGLIATSAVMTAVIGLSMQDSLGNIFAGLSLQMEGSLSVGDWIRFGEIEGVVREIRWRATMIETRNGDSVLIPNSTLVKNPILVQGRRSTFPRIARRAVHFNVDFRYSPQDVIDAVLNGLRAAPPDRVLKEPVPDCIVREINDSFARYEVRFWITQFNAEHPISSEVRTRVYYALKRAGIPLSIPAQAVFVTEDTRERKAAKVHEDLEQRLQSLAQVDLFVPLSHEERRAIASRLRHAPYLKGEVMTRQGAVGHRLYIIVRGEVSVRVAAEGGAQREVARLGAGKFFGEMSLMTGEPRQATVVALSDVECYRLDKASFQQLLQARPTLAEKLAEVLAIRKVELTAIKEGHDEVTQQQQLQDHKEDLVGKIRSFFGL